MKIEYISTICFALAVLHSFLVSPIHKLSKKFPDGSFSESILELLGEIEIVFGFWGAIFLLLFAVYEGPEHALTYHESLKFTEPIFVFVIMVIASTRPILALARDSIVGISRFLRFVLRTPEVHTEIFVILSLGTIAGSFITEPAAMTVCAMLLFSMLSTLNTRVLYFVVAVLFVNISIGGSLTPFAAPPILMVAKPWGWDLTYIFSHFGWKSAVAVFLNAFFLVLIFRRSFSHGLVSLRSLSIKTERGHHQVPYGTTLIHLLFLVAAVLSSHHSNTLMGVFLLFLGVTTVTKRYQDRLRLKESLLVAFFLGGLIVFGQMQSWWLQPLLTQMEDLALFLGATGLTAITDNAALTYLGTQVASLSEASKNALVAGAIAGGGLTIIANAPNAAGFGILADKFPERNLNPMELLRAAILPTLIAALCLWLLPTW